SPTCSGRWARSWSTTRPSAGRSPPACTGCGWRPSSASARCCSVVDPGANEPDRLLLRRLRRELVLEVVEEDTAQHAGVAGLARGRLFHIDRQGGGVPALEALDLLAELAELL